MMYTEALLFDLEQSGWLIMSQAEAGCLLWLQDLTMRNQHQIKLSKTIHQCWDNAEARGEEFTVQDFLTLALQHWGKVRETELMMSKPTDKVGGPATGETSEEAQPKKKKKNKPKGTTTDQSGTATTVTKEKAPPKHALKQGS